VRCSEAPTLLLLQRKRRCHSCCCCCCRAPYLAKHQHHEKLFSCVSCYSYHASDPYCCWLWCVLQGCLPCQAPAAASAARHAPASNRRRPQFRVKHMCNYISVAAV
jgi:hypothetical protein